MILRSADASPFARMVRIAAHVLGLHDEITIDPFDPADPDDTITSQNPLGKIPALLVERRVIYDSRVILEYLDLESGGGKIIPSSGGARIDVLIRLARASGMLDAALLVVYETRLRPQAMVVEEVMQRQRGKIRRGLESVAAESPSYGNGSMPQVDEIGLAAGLDYLDLRGVLDWRDHAPMLADWMSDFASQVPGYHATLPEGIASGITPAPWRQ